MTAKSFVARRLLISHQIQVVLIVVSIMIIGAIATGLGMAEKFDEAISESHSSIANLEELSGLAQAVKDVQLSVLGIQENINHYGATYGHEIAPTLVDTVQESAEFSAHFVTSAARVKEIATHRHLADVTKSIDLAIVVFPAYAELGQEVARSYLASNAHDNLERMDRFDQTGDRLVSTIDEIIDTVNSEQRLAASDIVQKRNAATATIRLLNGVLWSLGAAALVIIGAIFAYARIAVTRPLMALVGQMESLARGDFVEAGVKSDRGDEIGLLARSIDSVRRAEIERVQREHEARLVQMRDLADASVEGLMICDGVQLVATNRSFQQLTGKPDHELIGLGLSTLVPDASALIQVEMASGQPVETRIECVGEDPIPVEIVAGNISYQGKQHRVFAVRDLRERRKAEESIRFLARHDPLTKLANRHWFHEEMEIAMRRVGRGDSVGVICLDLDHFKDVNDTLGHPIGDALLRSVAERLKANTRGEDVIARLGGDEFAIIQVGADQPASVTALAERLIRKIGEPYEIEGHHITVGASAGIALAPHNGVDTDDLIKKADVALYKSKSEGRGVFRLFESGMDQMLLDRRAMEADLRKALASNEFELFYQPQVDAKSRTVRSFEALLRWRHPQRGLVAPLDFIPMAEEIGLMGLIGAWILRKACTDARSWPNDIGVAVNISAAQFRNNALDRDVHVALAESGLHPHRLELELTESVLFENTDRVIETMTQLRAAGITIAMDDFGTGYSSLSYLSRFPIDKIKIDRSFVNESVKDPSSLAIIRAVVGLTSSLGMKSTAEGVETTEQLSLLQLEGCTELQGYLFSKPVPASNIPKLLEALAMQPKLAA